MESLESATKRGARIIAEYLGGAITCDAHHMTDPRSDGLGVSSCISKSLEDAGVSPEEVRNREQNRYKKNLAYQLLYKNSRSWVGTRVTSQLEHMSFLKSFYFLPIILLC